MTKEVILLLKAYKDQWAILKDETSATVDKRTACKEIISLQEKLVKVKPDFEFVDLSMTKYSEFIPVDYKHTGKVNWREIGTLTPIEEQALHVVRACEAIAVQETRELIPKESVDTQKFGMIVSAKTEKIINAYYNEKKLKLYIKED